MFSTQITACLNVNMHFFVSAMHFYLLFLINSLQYNEFCSSCRGQFSMKMTFDSRKTMHACEQREEMKVKE